MANSVRLSILVCSLHSRATFLARLVRILTPQLVRPHVEFLVDIDERQKSVGAKRNDLIRRAQGEYVAFIDDDDRVPTDYVWRILQAIRSVPDCCGMDGIITFSGRTPRQFILSLRYNSWFEKGGVYYRNPNHLNPVKREHALRVPFPQVNYGEDRVYSAGLLPFLKREVYIEGGPMYFYDFVEAKA